MTGVIVNAVAASIVAALSGRRKQPPAPELLALEQVLALDPKRRLNVVRCGSRRLLLLTGGEADVSLGWLPETQAAETQAAETQAAEMPVPDAAE